MPVDPGECFCPSHTELAYALAARIDGDLGRLPAARAAIADAVAAGVHEHVSFAAHIAAAKILAEASMTAGTYYFVRTSLAFMRGCGLGFRSPPFS